MKQWIWIFALWCGAWSASAQTLVKGRILDTENQPVGYATAAIVRDSLPLAAAASDLDGRFELRVREQGAYTLTISSVGYSTYTAPLSIGNEPLDLGEIHLTAGVEVDAVVLTVQKPIVTADAEKLSYSVEDDPEAQSSTLEEIIRKVPQLSIDAEGNVLMNGQSDYKILVNGHPSNAMSRNFSEVIRSMPANSIKRIEVITNPSMKYDGEGTGGVLNIITTKARFDGYNGALNASWQQSERGVSMSNNSATFAVQTGKLTLSSSLYYSFSNGLNKPLHGMQTELENLTDDSSYAFLRNDAHYGFDFNTLYANLQASYQIDSLNLLTAEFSVFNGESRTRQHSHIHYTLADGSTLLAYDNRTDAAPSWYGYDLGVNYQHTFGRENHTLTLSDNLSLQPTTGSPMHDTISPIVGEPSYLDLHADTRAREVQNTVQIDYNNPLGEHHAIEAGLKHTYENNNEASMNSYDETMQRIGESSLAKQIVGLYGGYAYTTQKLAARIGVRYEYAHYALDNHTEGADERYHSSLSNLIPYASLTYQPKIGQMWAFSYTQRLRRPGVEAMSPYINENLTTREYGNPDLETGVSHSLNLRYSYMTNKVTLAVGATTNISSNLASQYSFVDDEGIFNSTYANDGRMQFYMADFSLSWRPSTRFNLSLSGKGGWGSYKMPNQGIRTEGWSFNQSFNLMVGLWKGARLTLSEFCAQFEPSMSSRWTSPLFFTSMRLGQKFLNDKLECSITVQNPFERTTTFKQLAESPTYRQTTRHESHARSVRIALSWRFGKQGIAVKQTNRKADTHTESMDSDKSSSANGGGMMN